MGKRHFQGWLRFQKWRDRGWRLPVLCDPWHCRSLAVREGPGGWHGNGVFDAFHPRNGKEVDGMPYEEALQNIVDAEGVLIHFWIWLGLGVTHNG